MDAFSNPMQNLFYTKRLSFRHWRYCFHKGFFFFFPTKPLEKEIQWLYLICHTKRKFGITVCSIRTFFFSSQSINHFLETHILQWRISRKVWQWALLVVLPLWISCATPRSLLHTDKSTSCVAIVILSCWALHYLEGNQMGTRSGEQYRVNVRQLKVICAIIFGGVWVYWRQDASHCKSLGHSEPKLMFGYLDIDVLWYV